MTKLRWVLGLLVVATLGFSIVPASAQQETVDTMQIVLEKMRADKKLLIAENMQLTEGEAKSFWPVYERYQDELFLLRTRTLKMLKDYEEAYAAMTNEKARKLLDEFVTLESLRLKLYHAYLQKFRKTLPEIKVVRYYQLENKIQAAVMYELARSIPLVK